MEVVSSLKSWFKKYSIHDTKEKFPNEKLQTEAEQQHACVDACVEVCFPYGSLLSGAVFANVPSQQKSSKALPPLCLLYKIKIIMMYDSENGWRSLITLRGSKNPEDPLIAL